DLKARWRIVEYALKSRFRSQKILVLSAALGASSSFTFCLLREAQESCARCRFVSSLHNLSLPPARCAWRAAIGASR
ncbi:hypothetical protein A2U01_0078847, partial [Trifolium medium]|nr:hypothetical protein [Trifolium medium]